jgi:hypothetical protein
MAVAICLRPSQDWNGTWKLNPAKSNTAGPSFTISITPDGMYHSGSADFRCDGKVYPAANSFTITCTQKGSSDLEIVDFKNGSKTYTAHWVLSPDGKSLATQSTTIQADGSAKSNEHHYTRLSGSAGFVGGWRNVNPLEGVAAIRQISLRGRALREVFPASGQYTNVLLGGTDAAIHGPGVPAGATIAVVERNPREFSTTTKAKGQIVDVGDWQISADGRSLTVSYWFPARPNEKSVLVYEKQ